MNAPCIRMVFLFDETVMPSFSFAMHVAVYSILTGYVNIKEKKSVIVRVAYLSVVVAGSW